MFNVKKSGINLKEKNIDILIEFIKNNFGDVDDSMQLNAGDLPFVIYYIKKSKFDTPMLVTLGLHAIQSSKNPKQVFGNELFVRMPKDWEYTQELNYSNGWINMAIKGVADLIREGNPVFPGSTYEFKHLANGTNHCALVANFSNIGDEFTICPINSNQCVPFFELQTVLPNELDMLLNNDESVLEEIFHLNSIDLQRGVS